MSPLSFSERTHQLPRQHPKLSLLVGAHPRPAGRQDEQVARAQGVPVTPGKIEELRDIMGYGVMSTPGVVIDGKVVHAGGVPSRGKVEQWLSS